MEIGIGLSMCRYGILLGNVTEKFIQKLIKTFISIDEIFNAFKWSDSSEVQKLPLERLPQGRSVILHAATVFVSSREVTILTNKQKNFCEEYLIGLNATQSAIRAGYSPKQLLLFLMR